MKIINRVLFSIKEGAMYQVLILFYIARAIFAILGLLFVKWFVIKEDEQ